jgi:hypothetical protein
LTPEYAERELAITVPLKLSLAVPMLSSLEQNILEVTTLNFLKSYQKSDPDFKINISSVKVAKQTNILGSKISDGLAVRLTVSIEIRPFDVPLRVTYPPLVLHGIHNEFDSFLEALHLASAIFEAPSEWKL